MCEQSLGSGSKRCGLLAVLVGYALLLLGGPLAAQETLERVREAGTIRVGIADERPYAYRTEAGEVTGEAPEIARVVLQRVTPGVTIEWVQGSFGQLIPMLRGGEVDLVAAGMFITPERCELASFSEPTYVVGEALLVKAGNPKGLANFQSVSDRADAKVGMISGTVEYNYALVTGIPADRAPLYVDLPEAVAALEEGEVDAVAMTALTAKEIVAQHPQLESTPQFYPVLDGVEVQGYGGFVFRLEDTSLRDAFQAELAGFIGSDAHWELVAPFGFTPEMAPNKNTEALCAG